MLGIYLLLEGSTLGRNRRLLLLCGNQTCGLGGGWGFRLHRWSMLYLYLIWIQRLKKGVVVCFEIWVLVPEIWRSWLLVLVLWGLLLSDFLSALFLVLVHELLNDLFLLVAWFRLVWNLQTLKKKEAVGWMRVGIKIVRIIKADCRTAECCL